MKENLICVVKTMWSSKTKLLKEIITHAFMTTRDTNWSKYTLTAYGSLEAVDMLNNKWKGKLQITLNSFMAID